MIELFFKATGISPEQCVLIFLNFGIGALGSWIYYCIAQFSHIGFGWTFKSCLRNLFPLLMWFFIGGITAVAFAPLMAYRASIMAGFGAMAFWEQLLPEGKGPILGTTKVIPNTITKRFKKLSEKDYKTKMAHIMETYKINPEDNYPNGEYSKESEYDNE